MADEPHTDMATADAAGSDASLGGVPYFDAALTVDQHDAEEVRKRDARYDTQFYTKELKRRRARQRLVVAAVLAASVGGTALWLALAPPAKPIAFKSRSVQAMEAAQAEEPPQPAAVSATADPTP